MEEIHEVVFCLPNVARKTFVCNQVGVMSFFVTACWSPVMVALAGAILLRPTRVCLGIVAACSNAAV